VIEINDIMRIFRLKLKKNESGKISTETLNIKKMNRGNLRKKKIRKISFSLKIFSIEVHSQLKAF
jgi:hypothetical protein